MHMATTATVFSTGQPPLHGAKADIVLRTSDNVDFYAHKRPLSMASPFFYDRIFPSKPDSDLSDPHPNVIVSTDGICVIPLTEDGQTIDYLLCLIYSIRSPVELTDLSMVTKFLEAAVKYDLENAITLLVVSLKSFISQTPLRVYAVSCRLNLEAEAALSAEECRKRICNDQATSTCQRDSPVNSHDLSDSPTSPCSDRDCRYRPFEGTLAGLCYVSEMREITAGCYFRLLRYLRSGVNRGFCEPKVVTVFDALTTNVTVSPYDDMEFWVSADVALQSFDNEIIYTHKLLLALASATSLLEMTCDPNCPTHQGLPLLAVDMDGQTLALVIRVCRLALAGQNVKAETFGKDTRHQLARACAIWVAAKKYRITKVMNIARKSCLEHLPDHAVAVYFTAVSLGWYDEARKAAQTAGELALLDSVGVWHIPVMETTSAEILYRLYKYLHEYREASSRVTLRYLRQPYAGHYGIGLDMNAQTFKNLPQNIPILASAIVLRQRLGRGYYDTMGEDEELAKESRAFFHDVRQAIGTVHLQTDENQSVSDSDSDRDSLLTVLQEVLTTGADDDMD